MALFTYRAKNGTETVEGTVDAQTQDEAIEKVSQLGLLPMSVTEANRSEGSTAQMIGMPFGRISTKDVTVFTLQMSSMIKSGIPILRALSIIAQQTENRRLRGTLTTIIDDIKNGGDFSTALTRHSRIFSPVYIAMVRSGEHSGNLQEVLLRIAEYRLKDEEVMSRVKSALAYPVLMALVGIGTVIFMLAYVMPRVMKIFSTIDQELPVPTKVLISVSAMIRHGWYWVIGIIAIAVFAIRRGMQNKAERLVVSRLALSVPIFGQIVAKSELSRFCRTSEVLIKSGVTVLQAIEIAIPVLKNEVFKDRFTASRDALREGESFGRTLERSKTFPPFMTNLIIIGEESGRLDEAMGEVATSYERDIDSVMRTVTSLLEPAIILVMGLIVGFIVIAMLLPIFQIDILAR